MKIRTIAIFAAAVFAGAIGGSLVGPKPAEAVAREIIDLQRDVTTLLQGQKDMSDQTLKDHTVLKTLVEQASDNVGKLNSTMSSVQKSVQDVQANSGARLDTMSTQVQGLSDNLEEIKSRLGKLNQQLVDLLNTVQSLDAKISGGSPAAGAPANTGALNGSPAGGPGDAPDAGGSAPSANTLYSNGQFYLGEIAYSQKQYDVSVVEYDKVLTNYPKSFKLGPAHLKKGLALMELGQKQAGIKELREVVKLFPNSDEERRARAKLKEVGAPTTAAAR